jgi:glucuronate isomerase
LNHRRFYFFDCAAIFEISGGMSQFINEDFLLQTRTARRLYHDFAKPEAILDYHCHLPPKDLAENRRFANLFEIWLEGDHYKWRAMRWNGVPERFVTGDATPFEKFKAWAATVPHTVRNPLYHWTHLELSRYFGIHELLNEESAERIWHAANEQLSELTTHRILEKFRVTNICTTDDPSDDLSHHVALSKAGIGTKVLPTFRPDKALAVNNPGAFNAWVAALAKVDGKEIRNVPSLLAAIKRRAEFFHEIGCRLSDHGPDRIHAEPCTEREMNSIFSAVQFGRAASHAEHAGWSAYLMLFLGRLYAEKGWTMQLHIGALRNNNTRLLRTLGPDTGFDSIGDLTHANGLSAFLDKLDDDNALPKTILYNLNPADNYAFATMAGNFQDGTVAAKVQIGSGWWFLDQKEGMEWQLNSLSNLGLLSRFIGMVTDSRSFMSYPRHEYFRRVLCNLVGKDIEAGEIPDDDLLVGPMIRNICHANAAEYLKL